MEDFQRKRRLIEHGQLTSWERRGRSAFTVEHVPFHRTLLQMMFRAGWLRTRGERNARNAVVRTLRCTFDALPSAFCGFTLLHLSDLHADGLPGLGRAAAPRRDRHAVRPRQVHGPQDVLARLDEDHAQRMHLVDAGVGGIQGAGDRVEPDFSGNLRLQLAPQGAALNDLELFARQESQLYSVAGT